MTETKKDRESGPFFVVGSGFNGDCAAHFVILSEKKRRMLNNGLSEI